MKPVYVSEELLTYLKQCQGRVKKSKGFEPSLGDLLSEIVFAARDKGIVPFNKAPIHKVKSIRVRTHSGEIPRKYIEYMKSMGFQGHKDAMYYHKDGVVIFYAKVSLNRYIIKHSVKGILYTGRLPFDELKDRIPKILKSM